MADYFNGKQYNEYFEKLNSRLNNASDSKPQAKSVVPPKPKPKKRGFYKVLRLRKGFFLSVLAVILAIVLIIVCAKSCGGEDETAVSEASKATTGQSAKAEKQSVTEKVVFEESEDVANLPKDNDAKTGIVVKLSDKRIIASRDAHKRIYPASTLKIMTILTAVDYIEDFDDTFTMSLSITDPLYVQEASVAGFLDGEEVTVTDLLYGTILPSGADAAMGLAIKIAGSEEAFVELMNKKVQALGLENTHFSNATGLFAEDNYSTAYDMAVILYHAYQNELCRKVLSTYQHTTQKTPQNPKGIMLQSTLFSYMYGTEPKTATIMGGKTGFVNEAGYCIASFGENNDNKEKYIAVTMGNSSKWPAFYGQIDIYKAFAK